MKIYDGSNSTAQPSGDRISVGIGELAVTSDGARLVSNGLGSCVGVALYDPNSDVRGLVHVMLPEADGRDAPSRGKFADSGIETLIEEMVEAGADRGSLEARIAGGSDMLDLSNAGGNIGERNIQAVKSVLDEFAIPIVGENLGGDYGRSVEFREAGELTIKTADGDRQSLS